MEPGVDEPEPDVQLIKMERDSKRPAGARFGALVHATLAAVPLDANSDQGQHIAALYGRVLRLAHQRDVGSALARSR